MDACAFCGMCVNFCPLGAFNMTIEEKADETAQPDKTADKNETPGTKKAAERGEKASATDISKAEAAET